MTAGSQAEMREGKRQTACMFSLIFWMLALNLQKCVSFGMPTEVSKLVGGHREHFQRKREKELWYKGLKGE